MYSLKSIESSLKKGILLDERSYGMIFALTLTPLIFPILFLIMAIFVICGLMEFDYDIAILFFLGTIFFLIPLSIGLKILIDNKKIEKYVKNCLEDAIEISAKVSRLSDITYYAKPNQIVVTFVLDEIGHRLLNNPKYSINNKYYLKFIRKKVKVLYSPKHDDVLFIKENNNKKSNRK